MYAIVLGGPGVAESFSLADVPEPQPVLGHELVRVTRAGVNFAEMSMRVDGFLGPARYPFIPGTEFVGVAPDGRRVAALTHSGAYAEKALAPGNLTWNVPDYITDDEACSLTLHGQSAYHCLYTTLRVQRKETVLVPDAAGSLGSLAVQIAQGGGRKIIALECDEQRRETALKLGAHAVVDSSSADGLTERIMDAAGGRVDAALAPAGSPILAPVLDALTHQGRMAVFGQAASIREPLFLSSLRGHFRSISRFWLPDLFSDLRHPYHLMGSMETLFRETEAGRIKPLIGAVHDLSSAIQVHTTVEDARACRPVGKVMLDPTRPYPHSQGVVYETRPADPPFLGWGGF
ncbi:quinone oxidoreductase family protein [Streptomyces sp. NPDC002537]